MTIYMTIPFVAVGVYLTALAIKSGKEDRPVVRLFFRIIFSSMYRVRVRGLEHIQNAGGGVMVISNHQSLIDGLLLAVYLPGMYSFVVNRFMAGRWWARLFLCLVDTHVTDTNSPMAIKRLVEIVKQGGRLVVFPEGRITTTGAMMKTYDGPGLIADKGRATVIPARIEGAHMTHFSRITHLARPRLFPRITITLLPPVKLNIEEGVSAKRRRRVAGDWMERLMVDSMFRGADCGRTLEEAMRDSVAVYGQGRGVYKDSGLNNATLGRLLSGSGAMAPGLPPVEANGRIGVMAPGSVRMVQAVLAIQMAGKVPVMLNYDWPEERVVEMARAAELEHILVSRDGGASGRLIEAAGIRAVYMEELKGGYPPAASSGKSADSPAILFPSEEGAQGPWVVHSHRSLLSNIHQLAAVIDFKTNDIIYSASPLSSYEGFSIGVLAPLLFGMAGFICPAPGRDFNAAEEAYGANVTVVSGGAGELETLANQAHPYDFANVRRVLCHGEGSASAARLWRDKFGAMALEIKGGPWTGFYAAQSPVRGVLDGVKDLPDVRRDGGRADLEGFSSPGMAAGYAGPSRGRA